LTRYGIACPTISGASTGSFEFEAASGLYTELQCGSYIIFMEADYGRDRDRDGAPFTTFEPSLYVWATVMSRPAEDGAIVDAGLKTLAFDSATYERVSDEHGRLGVSAATNRLGLGDKIRLIPGHCDRQPPRFPPPRAGEGLGGGTGMSVSAATASSRSGRSPPAAPFIDGCRSELANNNGRWIVALHEADVSALSTNALVRGKPVPACYFSRRSLTKKSKKVWRVLRPLGDGGVTSPGGRGPSSPRILVPWAWRASRGSVEAVKTHRTAGENAALGLG
jgi:hypothetical protein